MYRLARCPIVRFLSLLCCYLPKNGKSIPSKSPTAKTGRHSFNKPFSFNMLDARQNL